jgi:FtsH-binding integral membrane protein
MILFLIWFFGVMVVATVSAYWSVKVNQGVPNASIGVIVVGILISSLWVFLSKVTSNFLRDTLIWDVLFAATFSFVLIYFGYGAKYELKHWIGIGLLVASFGYWLVIDWI